MSIILFIIAVIGAIVGIGLLMSDDFKVIGWITTAVAVVLAIVCCFTTVSAGVTAIPVTFGKIGDFTLDAGIHWVGPFTSVVKMNNREQKETFDFLAFSSDMQEVRIQCAVNFMINKETAMNLYRNVGTNYKDTLLYPRVLEDTKVVISGYTAEGLIVNRASIASKVQELLTTDFTEKGIIIMDFSIADIDFSDAFTDSVEAKQVATQNKLKAQTEQEQKTIEAKAEAERRKIAAEATAAETTIKAQAEADANKLITDSLTPELIKYIYANNWNGSMPLVTNGENMMMDISSLMPQN